MRLAEAVEHHSKTFIEAIREGDGYSPPEAHEGLNQANRTLILAMHEELASLPRVPEGRSKHLPRRCPLRERREVHEHRLCRG